MRNPIFLCALAILFAGCNKKSAEPELPAATHHGANTFGCKINGEVFSVSGKSYMAHPDGIIVQPFINAPWYIKGKLNNKAIILEFNYNGNPHVPATFGLAEYPYQATYYNHTDGTVPGGNTEYNTDSVHAGNVFLTDYTTTYTSGTFAYDAINGDGNVVHVTEGRFDIAF